GDDEIIESSATAAGHRIDAVADLLLVTIDQRAREERSREQRLAGGPLARFGCRAAPFLHARLAAEPAPDAEQVDEEKHDIGPHERRLAGEQRGGDPAQGPERE